MKTKGSWLLVIASLSTLQLTKGTRGVLDWVMVAVWLVCALVWFLLAMGVVRVFKTFYTKNGKMVPVNISKRYLYRYFLGLKMYPFKPGEEAYLAMANDNGFRKENGYKVVFLVQGTTVDATTHSPILWLSDKRTPDTVFPLTEKDDWELEAVKPRKIKKSKAK